MKNLNDFFIVAMLCGLPLVVHGDDHLSQVSLSPDANAGESGDVDGAQGIIARVGQPLHASIHFQIGWFVSRGNGQPMELRKSDINDPEYEMLYANGYKNPSVLPAGLGFAGDKGELSGTPTEPGLWKYQPAVRDKQHGESPYRGHGYWWTDTATSSGKTWIEAKDAVPVIVLPALSGKEIMLQCNGQMTAAGWQSYGIDLLVEMNYEQGIVRVIGNDGKTAGVYHATVTDDFVAWGSTNIYKPSFMASSVKIDRKTGAITTTASSGGGPTLSGSCQKRSAEQKF